MTYFDARGLPISTTSGMAAGLYREGVDLLLSAWPGVGKTLDEAIAADPEFALAYAARARLHGILGESAEARACIVQATEIVVRNGTPRERSHVATLALAVTGQSSKALESTLAHVDAWPRDVLILSLPLGAFGLLAFSGIPNHDQARVDLCERYAAHFAPDDWWFLTYRGWSHVENGAVTLGRDLAERGFALRRTNANGAHIMAHAMFEDGAAEDAEAFILGWLPCYARSGILHAHLAWHAALSALERDDPQQALKIYAEHVQHSVTSALPLNVVTDSVSLLWRLQAYGYEVPSGLWDAAKAYSNDHFATPGFSFADAHMGLLAAATGDRAAAAARIDALTDSVAIGTLAAGPVVPAICRGALAFAEGDYEACVRILEPVAAEVVRIGGSGAQREVIEDTLLLALIRNGNAVKARAVLDRRLHRRPSMRDKRWLGHIAA